MKQIVIGTAGHVDHGKTSLILALTGIQTDRLKEEQERGMSIELGFASFRLPGGMDAGIVDVPGHERFLRTMLAGAAGMDLVLLVIAADEGVMPQTREHLHILELLHARAGIVVLTKTDLVEPEWLELMKEEVRDRLQGTFLADAEILCVSSTTRAGLTALVEAIDRLAVQVEARTSAGPFRLPIDRVFTMPGFGTVVTGTLWSGRIRAGESVRLQPSGIVARVRGLQSHGRKIEEALAGGRTAVNLAGVEVAEIRRGEVLAPVGLLQPTYLLDVRVELLKELERPLPNRTRIRLHLGTDERIGRMVLLDREELQPGAAGHAQLQLEEPVAPMRGDRFVLRQFSPMQLLGGGTVLEPKARRHRRFDETILDRLTVLEAGGLEDRILQALKEKGLALTAPRELAQSLGAEAGDVVETLDRLVDEHYLIVVGDKFLSAEVMVRAENELVTALAAFHRRFPLRYGLPREEAKSRLAPTLDNRSWGAILEVLAERIPLSLTAKTVRLSDHEPEMTPEQRQRTRRLVDRFLAEPFNPPALSEAMELLRGKLPGESEELFAALVEGEVLVKITPDLYLHRESVETAVSRMRDAFDHAEGFTAAQVRDLLGSSRKIVIPLLEYFDSKRLTRRVGDRRYLEES